ncbi:MAG: hypothetical protein IKX24_04175 [Prevotella sp.]|nr:hypothetical protein [Prevotella sp.]
MKKQYISPKAKINFFSTRVMIDETFPIGTGGGGIGDGSEIQSLDPLDPQNPTFQVWDDKDI